MKQYIKLGFGVMVGINLANALHSFDAKLAFKTIKAMLNSDELKDTDFAKDMFEKFPEYKKGGTVTNSKQTIGFRCEKGEA